MLYNIQYTDIRTINRYIIYNYGSMTIKFIGFRTTAQMHSDKFLISRKKKRTSY